VTRPVAVNLIEGRLSEVVAFLDTLTYSSEGPSGMWANYAEWDRNINSHSDWYATRRQRTGKAEKPRQ